MDTRVVMGIRVALSITFALLAALNVPLMLRRIRPNGLYGFRTPRTLSSPEVWYPANAFAGRALLIAAIVSLAATWLVPEPAYATVWVPLLICLGPLMLAVIASFAYLRRI
jgi:uncharacterized membrane protein